jgi:RND family efflux transporter MFP subunit
VKRAEAALASRRAQLADEEARSRQAIKDWKNLGRAGDPPPLVARQPQLADARANVLAAEADLEKARRDLQRTRITLPYDGLVRQRQVDLGQFVAPGTQLGITFSVDTAEVRLPVTPTDLAYLDLPSPGSMPGADAPIVELAAEEAGETLTWQARLVRTEGVLDEQSRVLYVVAEVIDPYGVQGLSRQPTLRVGTFVRAAIEGRYARDLVVLPRFVLRNDDTVLVANAERELEVRPVTVARAEPDLIYISSGIEDGEQVITTTLDAPIPGTRLVLAGQEARATEDTLAVRPGSTGNESPTPITEERPAATTDGS